MPLYIGDYLADTAHLDAERSGCYLHWLMHYWRKGPLPDDIEALITIGKLRSPKPSSIAQALLTEYFTKNGDGLWHHNRVDAEKNHWNARRLRAQEKASRAAKVSWEKRASRDAASNAQGMPAQCPSSSPSPLSERQKTRTLARNVLPEELAGTLPLVDGTDYLVSKDQVQEWSQAFPAVDVKQ